MCEKQLSTFFTVQLGRPMLGPAKRRVKPSPKAFLTPKAYYSLSLRVGTEEGLLQEYLWFLRAAYCKA